MGSLGRPGIHVRVILPVPQQHREHQNRGPGVTHCLALRRPHWHPHAPFLIKLSRLHVDLRKNRRQGAGRSVQPTGIVVVPSRCFGGLHLCHVHFRKIVGNVLVDLPAPLEVRSSLPREEGRTRQSTYSSAVFALCPSLRALWACSSRLLRTSKRLPKCCPILLGSIFSIRPRE